MMKKIKPERDMVKPRIKDIGEIINRNKRNSEGTGFHVGGSEGVGLKVEKGEIEGVLGEIINRNKRNSEGTGFHVGWSENGILENGNLEIYSINVLGENRQIIRFGKICDKLILFLKYLVIYHFFCTQVPQNQVLNSSRVQ